jgi:diamine N-acetyltransferase
MHSIRPATVEDAARIAVLGAHVWVHTYATAGVSDVIAQYVLMSFTPEKIHLAGYVVMRFGSYHADVPIEIETLYIQDTFSGRGIGSALLNHARGIAMVRTGNRAIWLIVNSHNEKAISFYRSRGMTQDGIAYFELGGIKHENKVMVARG